MSDPSGMLLRMAEMHLSATDFRVHLKDWANQVAGGGEAVIFNRHGFSMAALISWQDYQVFAQLKKKEKGKVPREDPDLLDVAQVERIYEETYHQMDEESIAWRSKALLSLWKRGRRPKSEPKA